MAESERAWHAMGVNDVLSNAEEPESQMPLEEVVGEWLTMPDLAEALGVSLRQARTLVEDREVVTARIGERNVVAVPAAFVQDGALVNHLSGTMTVLADSGFSDQEIIRWLCTPDATLPIDGAPIDMLRAGRRAEVRKRAMEEAF